ncbi:MAG: pectate lyase [Isosphaeraceae bacterium]
MRRLPRRAFLMGTSALAFAAVTPRTSRAAEPVLSDEAREGMRRAADYFRSKVAVHGGYVYHYALDLGRRWGEGEAGPEEVWVQPPGTPTVGFAYLKAHEATGDPFYLDAAREAASALMHGQLESGGWLHSIDFDPKGPRAARYRNGKGKPRGRNTSSLDDGVSQEAIRFLAHLDRREGFRPGPVHEAVTSALEALLRAQFPNGGFPQVWTGPVPARPVVKASYPVYDWRTEGKIKNYWDMYTLNDGLAGTVTRTLADAHEIYRDDRFKKAYSRLGDFLALAQMPDPQPAWAQQYDEQMRPIWARRFEPAAITGGESQDVLETLIKIHRLTGDPKYLEPIPRALAYLKRSLLPDGRLARYYELRTNRPLYMKRTGDEYHLTYDDSDLPSHYAFKVPPRLDAIEKAYQNASRPLPESRPDPATLERRVRSVLRDLDDQGRWVVTYRGERLVGQPKLAADVRILSSEVFARNLETLSRYVIATSQK